MPRFNDNEKKQIRAALMREGERLFAQKGLIDVTIDELCEAVGIGKGTFYSFYQNKAELFFSIIEAIHVEVDAIAIEDLKKTMNTEPCERVTRLFWQMLDYAMKRPILMEMNDKTINYLYRKLPPDKIEAHLHDDTKRIDLMTQHGLSFSVDIDIVAGVFQNLALTILRADRSNEPRWRQMADLMVRGVAQKLTET